MRYKYYSGSTKIFMLLIDLGLLNMSYVLSYLILFGTGLTLTDMYFSILALLNLTWVISSYYRRIYDVKKLASIKVSIYHLTSTFLVYAILIITYFISFNANNFSNSFLILAYSNSFVLLVILRLLYYYAIRYYRRKGFNAKKVIIIGTAESAKKLYHHFKFNLSSGREFIGFFDDYPSENVPKELLLGQIKDVKDFCLQENVKEIFYAKSMKESGTIQDITQFADDHFIHLRFVPQFEDLRNSNVQISFLNDVPVFDIPVLGRDTAIISEAM